MITIGNYSVIGKRRVDTTKSLIMYILLCLLLAAPAIYGFSCSGCICRQFQNLVSCYGRHLTKLPVLIDTKWPRHLDMLNTSITDIDVVKTWTNLESLEIRDNADLPCFKIVAFSRNYPQIITISDCDDDLRSNNDNITTKNPLPMSISKCQDTKNLWWHALMAIPTIIILMFCVYVKNILTNFMIAHRSNDMYVEDMPMAHRSGDVEESTI